MITYQTETLIAIRQEVEPILMAHWEEIAIDKDMALDVDWMFYYQSEFDERLKIVTVRDDGRLIGYASFFLMNHPHYKTWKFANQDILYIDPAYRGKHIGLGLEKFCEELFRGLGVQVMMHHAKAKHPALVELLCNVGYQIMDYVLVKKL